MRFIAFFVVYFGLHTLAYGQFLRTELANFPLPDTAQAQQLRLHIDLKHFFKNNEYFNDYAPGYTLPGLRLVPSLDYMPQPNLSISAGLQYNLMHGRDSLTDLAPFFRIHWRAKPWLSVVMGNLYSHSYHQLGEAVLNPEYDLYRQTEHGLQIFAQFRDFSAETWVDWSDFIWIGDKKNEKLWGGARMLLAPKFTPWFGMNIPVALTAWHTGGQIDDNSQLGQLMLNTHIGTELVFVPQRAWCRTILVGAKSYRFVNQSNADENGVRPGKFSAGKALEMWATWRTNSAEWQLSYWHGQDFYSPRGSWMYHNVSPFFTQSVGSRKFFRLKHLFERNFYSHFWFGLSFDAYYFPEQHQFDHSEGIYLRFERSYLLRKISDSSIF